MTEAELLRALTDQWWRLCNLYWIIDKDGNRIRFTPNWAQEEFYQSMHYMNIILKARQLGFSTFLQIYLLDVALFYPDTSCGLIAQTLDDAQGLFSNKVLFAYNNLPEEIKKIVYPVSQNMSQLELSNGSSIRVGTSLRGGTYQYIHISEFGKICSRFPDRAREIVTGALNTLAPGSYAFIESTAEGNEGKFFDMVTRARTLSNMGTKLTPMDWKFHFFPWYREPKYVLKDATTPIPPSLSKYFTSLASEQGIELTPDQQAWYAKKHEDQQDDMMREFPSTPDEAFMAAIEGSYYGEIFGQLERDGRISDSVVYDPILDVETWWDLGFNDAMTIWFVQLDKYGMYRVIDYYENHSEGLQHYAKVLRDKPYRYSRHVGPHDSAVHELGTGKSRQETAEQMGMRPWIIAPQLKVLDGIEAVRNMLPKCWFNATKCHDGIRALKNYRKDWDDKLGNYRGKPRHDWASHGADAFRTGAVAPAIVEGGGFNVPTKDLNIPNFGAV